MKIKIVLISLTLFLISPLWCATQDDLESERVIQTRRLSELPLENLERRQAIAKNLRQFFVPFDETATNLMVLNNLYEAVNGGISPTVQIWEEYLAEYNILTADQMPLFQTTYGSVLRALREGVPSYLDPKHYFRSPCFLALLFGELGEETFPRSYLKPFVFWEWRNYQHNSIPSFTHTFVRCLNEISKKMTSAISPTEQDCENWHSLPISGLQRRKESLDFSDFLEDLEGLQLQSVELGLKRTAALCTDFRASLATFHGASLPLVQEIDRIIRHKQSSKEKSSPSQIGQHLLEWSVAGRGFADYILLKGKEGNLPSLILKSLGTTLKEDAGIIPRFTISAEKSIVCNERMGVDISEASIRIFLEGIWPTLQLFFTKGELVPFTVYGAQHRSELQISFDGFEAQSKNLELAARKEKVILEKVHRAALANLTSKILSTEETAQQRARTLAEQKALIKKMKKDATSLEDQLEETGTIKKTLEAQLKEANAKLGDAQKKLESSRTSVAEDRIQQLEQDIASLKQTHQLQTVAAQTQFEKDLATLRKDLETRLQEAADQCRRLQEQLDLKTTNHVLTEISVLPKAAPERRTAPSPPPATGSAAGNDGTPPPLKRLSSLPPPTHQLSRNARVFTPATPGQPSLPPPISTVMTPDGVTWISAPNGAGWIPAHLYHPYPHFG